jgi:hypothetical protein
VIHLRDVRAMALGLAEAAEEDHFGKPSFRVRGRIFATLPDGEHLNVMVGPLDVDGAVEEHPAACRPLLWGKQVRGVRVNLRAAEPEMVRELLGLAWGRKAPRALLGPPSGRRDQERLRPVRPPFMS